MVRLTHAGRPLILNGLAGNDMAGLESGCSRGASGPELRLDREKPKGFI
jgi:hypothetical protein